MSVTKEQAMTASAFHEDHEPGAKVYRWRRNGVTQVWKTRPAEFRVPVKYGIHSYGQLTQIEAHRYHTEDDCPDKKAEEPQQTNGTGVSA
jgi:hypothetical protein